jgi:HSP20 family protein
MTQRRTNEGQSGGSTGQQSAGLARRQTPPAPALYGAGPSPFDLMRRFTEDVDRLFATFAMDSLDLPLAAGLAQGNQASATWTPPVDVSVRGDDLVVQADLPGIRPEDVTLELDGNNLILRGEMRQERQDQGYYERRVGTFYRRIVLPEGIQAENAQAQFQNGVLEITFPGAVRQLQPQRRQIAIQDTQRSPASNAPSQPAGTGAPAGAQGPQAGGQETQAQAGAQGSQDTADQHAS